MRAGALILCAVACAAGEPAVVTVLSQADGAQASVRLVDGEPVGQVTVRSASRAVLWQAEYPRRRAAVEADLRRIAPAFLTPPEFVEPPSLVPPHRAGRLAPESLGEAVAILNGYRSLAGIADTVVLDRELTDLCQHGAVMIAGLGWLGHRPPKPADMAQGFYDRAFKATSSGNLAATGTMLQNSLFFYIYDSDAANEQKVGHRRWCLNPRMGRTGFGAVGQYSVMYAHDLSARPAPWSTVTWPPAGWFATQLMPPSLAWMAQLNANHFRPPDRAKVQVRAWRLDRAFAAQAEIPCTILDCDAGIGSPGPTVVFRPQVDAALHEAAEQAAQAKDADAQQVDSWRVPGSGTDWLGLPAGEVRYRVRIDGLQGTDGGSRPLTWLVHGIAMPAHPPA